MSIKINDNLSVLAPKPIDDRYFNSDGLPYTNEAEVLSTINLSRRFEGLKVRILTKDYEFAADKVTLVLTGGSTDISGKVDKVTGKSLLSDTEITRLVAITGTNTGDETSVTIKSKLGITTLSGANTGDQDLSGKVDKVTNKSLILDTEITRLAGVSNFDNSANVTALSNKVDKITGKGLSTEDYSNTEKNKLTGVATGATANDTDANLKARANHTGAQTASTISDFTSASQTAAPAETTTTLGTLTNGATAKTTLIDADTATGNNSVGGGLIKTTWLNVWTYIKTKADLVYAPINNPQFLIGSGTPFNSTGYENWTYFDQNSARIYKKVSNIWTLIFTATGSIITVENQNAIGIIYDKSTFTDLSDFTQIGGSSWSVSSGKIVNSINNYNNTPKILELNKVQNFDSWKITVVYRRTATGSGTGYGLYLGMNSKHPTTIASLTATLDDGLNKATMYNSYNGQNFPSTEALSGFTNNIDVILTIQKTGSDFTAIVRNGSFSSNISVTSALSYTGVNVGPNISKPAINLLSQHAFSISQFKFESFTIKNNSRYLIGDSISAGFNAGSSALRFGSIMSAEIYAGSGDKTTEALLALPLFLAKIQNLDINSSQTKVFIMLGTNDKSNGVSDATYLTNLSNIVSQLETAGFKVIVISSPANNNYDMSGYNTVVATNFPTKYISGYNATKATSGTGLNSSYNSGDGVHLNATGNNQLATVIMASSLY